MRRRRSLALVSVLVGSFAWGCAEHDAAPPQTAAKGAGGGSAPAVSAPAGPAVAPGHLARGEVEGVLRRGPPWLLRRVQMEEVIRGGKFVGWRILSLSLPEGWQADLKPGDIVSKVNGLALERPEDLWAAWMQVYSAVELRLSGERDGRPREVVWPIDGPSGAAAKLELEAQPPPPRKPSRWQTKVIEGGDGVPAGDAQP